MPTGKITNRAVEALRPADRDLFLWDDEIPGFGLKITPKAAKTYVFSYRVGNGGRAAVKKRLTIGRHGPWNPSAARAEARRLKIMVDQGHDPAAKSQVQYTGGDGLELELYVEQFIEQYLQARWAGGWKNAAGILRNHVVPAWRGKKLNAIGRRDVALLMDSLSASPATARNAFAAIRRMFKWAVDREDLDASPVASMDPPKPPPSRDRVLCDEELIDAWMSASELDYPFGPFFKMLMLTCQRRTEVAAMEWSELSRSKQLWTIPASRAKNGTLLDVPLSRQAIALLDDVAAETSGSQTDSDAAWPKSGYVFTTTGKTPVTGYSGARRRLNDAIASRMSVRGEFDGGQPVKPTWRNHDLRRTVTTGLQALGVRQEVTSALLNHRSGVFTGVAGVYHRHEYGAEKRTAMQLWGDRLTSLMAGECGS